MLPLLKKKGGGGKPDRPGCAEKQARVLENNWFLVASQKAILISEIVKYIPPHPQQKRLCNLDVLCWLVIMI